MIINTLEPVNIILFNIYIIMLLQIALNWSFADCGTGSNIFQLIFVITMLLRLFFHEGSQNKIINSTLFKTLMLISSGCILTGISIYESYTISQHWNNFSYDP
jgi:hypothetical protein